MNDALLFQMGCAQFDDSVTNARLERLVRRANLRVIQSAQALSHSTADRLNTHFFAHRADVELRIYGPYAGEERDLGFASKLTNVRKFSADCLSQAKNVECVARSYLFPSTSLCAVAFRRLVALNLR